jgi:hypothetical protein
MSADYKRDGFLVLPDFLPAADCDALQEQATAMDCIDPTPPRHAYALHLIDRRAAYSADNWLQRPDLPLRGFA